MTTEFMAILATSQSNQTGQGQRATVKFDAVVYDLGSNYNPLTGVFTATEAKMHLFTTSVYMKDFNNANNTGLVLRQNGTKDFYLAATNATYIRGTPGDLVFSGAMLIPLSIGDTIEVKAYAYNGVSVSVDFSADLPSFLSGKTL